MKGLIKKATFFQFQLKYAKISSKENGSVKKGVIFATYSSLIGESQSGGKYNTRLKQLLKWCGKDFDGCVSFIKQVVNEKVSTPCILQKCNQF